LRRIHPEIRAGKLTEKKAAEIDMFRGVYELGKITILFSKMYAAKEICER